MAAFVFEWSLPTLGRQSVEGGSIFVHGPQVYTRERLVNDRYQEDSWLNDMLDRSKSERFGYGMVRTGNDTSKREAGLTVNAGQGSSSQGSSNQGAGNQTANNQASNSQTGHNKPGNNQGENPGLMEIAERPTFKLQATRAYREQIRTMLIENQLDDRHDLHGNTLYRLRFDATILPNAGSRAAAQIEIAIDPPALNSLPEWMSSKGEPSAAQFQEWLQGWRELYTRWRASLEMRIEEEASARARSYENGRFGPDDYDVLLARLRSGMLQIAAHIEETLQRLEGARNRQQWAVTPAVPQAPYLQQRIIDMTNCQEAIYRRADQLLAESPLREKMPTAEMDVIEVQHGDLLKQYRAAFVRGATSDDKPIESHDAHNEYRKRISDLLYLRRTVTQLLDQSECTKLQYDVPIVGVSSSGGPRTAQGQAPDALRASPGAAVAAVPPPGAVAAVPPPATTSPAPPVETPAPTTPASPPAGPGAAAAPQTQPPAPGPQSEPQETATGTNARAGTPPAADTAAASGPQQQLGRLKERLSDPPRTIDDARLRRRLLDSEFWPRIYKAVTGVDEWIVDIDDAVPGLALVAKHNVTPQSLRRFATVEWDPQRPRRTFQVNELVQSMNVALDASCLSGLYGPSDLFPYEEKAPDGRTTRTTALYIPRADVSALRESAPSLKIKPLLELAHAEMGQKRREMENLARQGVPINACDFLMVRRDVPVGLFNFAMKLSQAKDVYTYSISTAEPDELIANRIRTDLIRELGVQGTVNNLAQGTLSADGRIKAQEEIARFLRFDSVQRSVFGYGRKASQAKIGWHVLPLDQPAKEKDLPYLAPKQIPMTALVSLPAWWEKVNLTVSRGWVDSKGRVTPIEDEEVKDAKAAKAANDSRDPKDPVKADKPSYPIDLPTNFETLDASLFPNADSGPVLIDWQLPRAAARPCQPFAVTLIGRRLWRSTVVTLAGERANRVLVMPNMNGIIATFDKAPLPGNLRDVSGMTEDDKYYAQLTVWTSQGHVHLPRLIRFEPPPAGLRACPKDPPEPVTVNLPGNAPGSQNQKGQTSQ